LLTVDRYSKQLHLLDVVECRGTRFTNLSAYLLAEAR
jgi:hypothetical protein